jgi:hypothetical protein
LSSVDINSNNPILRIGSRLYSGQFANNIGTYLLFEEKPENLQDIAQDKKEINIAEDAIIQNSVQNFNFSGKTFKKLILNRLFVQQKSSTI